MCTKTEGNKNKKFILFIYDLIFISPHLYRYALIYI